jgi:hypothetical protein
MLQRLPITNTLDTEDEELHNRLSVGFQKWISIRKNIKHIPLRVGWRGSTLHMDDGNPHTGLSVASIDKIVGWLYWGDTDVKVDRSGQTQLGSSRQDVAYSIKKGDAVLPNTDTITERVTI